MTASSQLEVRVVARTREAIGIDSFELAAHNGDALPSFTAGAHIDVQVPGGFVRQYSLSNDPAESHRYVVSVLNDEASRGGSAAMHEQVDEGTRLCISAPRNRFPLDETATHSVLLAGGIGVTPLLSMAERLVATNSSFELHYCTRTADRTAFSSRLSDARFDSCIHHHYDDGEPEQLLDLAGVLAQDGPGAHLYVCGPAGFMEWVLASARSARWPEEQLHYEYFTAAPLDDTADGGEFDVELSRSGGVIRVAADETVIAALAAHGITVPVSCEQGVCGTCLVGVLDGEPDHRDLYLMPKEHAANDQFLPCCSRALSPRLVLDL